MRYEPRASSDSGAASDDQRSKLRRIAHAAQWAALGGMALVVAYSAYLWTNHTALITYVQRDIFRLFGKRQFFDPAAPRLLVRLGELAVVVAAGGIAVRTLVVLLMTSANPPGQRQLLLEIGSDEISFLVAALLFFAFALVVLLCALRMKIGVSSDNGHHRQPRRGAGQA
jgi:hypothetical protein